MPGSARAGEDGLRISLPAQLDEGSYTVSYHVVSLDGHSIEGSIVFSVAAAFSGSSTIEDADWTTAWRRAFVIAHGLLYLGLFGAVGGVAYERLIGSDSLGAEAGRRVRVAAALLGLIAAVAALGLQGGLLLGGPPSLLAQPGTWMEGLGSTFGRTALCAMLGLVLIGAASRHPTTRLAQALAILGSLVALASFGLSGHVVTAGALGLTLPALLIHAAMAAFWVGSLVPLLRTLAAPGRAASPEIHRFSGFAVPAVFVLVAAGLLLAWIQVRTPGMLATTGYGLVLLAKVGLVTALLALAGLNRLFLTPALARGEPSAARRLGRSIRAEIGLVVLILAATAALGTTPPPRALLAAAGPADAHAHAEHGTQHLGPQLTVMAESFMAEIVLTPGEVGANAVAISVTDHEGKPLDIPEVVLRLSNPEMGVAPIERPAERTGLGEWRVADLPLAFPGTWLISVDALISDVERQTAEIKFEQR